MSDSELSEASQTPTPPDGEIEKSLRHEVAKAAKSEEEYTYRSVRTASEISLGLKPGFYKSHEVWNKKSKEVIDNQISHLDDPPKSPQQPKKKSEQGASEAKSQKSTLRAHKRPSPDRKLGSRKKAKFSHDDSPALSSNAPSKSGSLEKKVASPKLKKAGPKSKSEAALVASPKVKGKKSVERETVADEGEEDVQDISREHHESESEMSEVLDEEPRPRKKEKVRSTPGVKSKKDRPAKSKTDADEDPDVAEIKRLQGWLVKCGIRKLWGKELKPYETSKMKINHLKDMLSDIGMTGRYSIEKASQIREARELAADMEAVKEGAERWGTGEDIDEEDEEEAGGRPSRRLVRGAKNYDFLSSDGEETD